MLTASVGAEPVELAKGNERILIHAPMLADHSHESHTRGVRQ